MWAAYRGGGEEGKGYVAPPPSKIIGGGWPPWPLHSSYGYVSVYIGPSPRERQKEERKDRTPRHWKFTHGIGHKVGTCGAGVRQGRVKRAKQPECVLGEGQ